MRSWLTCSLVIQVCGVCDISHRCWYTPGCSVKMQRARNSGYPHAPLVYAIVVQSAVHSSGIETMAASPQVGLLRAKEKQAKMHLLRWF